MSKCPDSTQFLELMHALEDWKFYLNTDGVCCLDKVAEDKSKRNNKQSYVL